MRTPSAFSSPSRRRPSLSGLFLALSVALANAAIASGDIDTVIRPAVPDEFSRRAAGPARAAQSADDVTLANDFLTVHISRREGVIFAIENKLTGETHVVTNDHTGFAFHDSAGNRVVWQAGRGAGHDFHAELSDEGQEARVTLATSTSDGRAQVRLQYVLAAAAFWVERRISVDAGAATYGELIYGAATVPEASVREVKLGKFDTPRLIQAGRGGLFAGVGWWFYEVADGSYRNTRMDYATTGRFDAEPWYVGVFQPEAGEPYAGWLWYKTFLGERKLAHDKRRSYFLWNARSGYDFRPISDPNILDYVGTAEAIGLNGVTTGVIRGVKPEAERAASDPTARRVVNAFTTKGIDFGLHEGAVNAARWRTDAALAEKLAEVDRAWEQGIRQLSVDFFGVGDTFAEHRRVTTFFRHIRERMNYTECHLGMAAYGPQFQREVLINHPTDLHGFDIGRFSADWATFTGFRHSRRKWQLRYDYLMPENGLFYFSTHYSNYPRRYEEPEPQQFLFIAHAWRGLAYAFHDKIGFRDSLAAQAAFSTFYVFGYLDAHLPAADRAFARAYLDWVRANADVLNRGRVAHESDDALVMSKVRDGRGAIFAVNYTPGAKRFRLRLDVAASGVVTVRQVYPVPQPSVRVRAGAPIDFEVPGERVAIFEVNDGLQGLPPANPRALPVDVTGWTRTATGHEATFLMPDVRGQLSAAADPSLPARVVSADQTETEYVTNKNSGKSPGPLPREFLDAYGFTEDKYLETWKAAPWAFADRVWFVYKPGQLPRITEAAPVVTVNGRTITMSPRVEYEPSNKDAREWKVALWFADVTAACTYGGENRVTLSGIGPETPGHCYVTGAAAPPARAAR